MPDFERVTRSLELHVAATPEQAAFVRGKHAGQDLARWQVAKIAAIVAILLVPVFAFADEVIGITDGDTLTVLHERKPLKIRLGNIDAPEKKQAFGEKSKQSLSEMCFSKNATYVVQSIDRYGRTVAVVKCAGVEVNRVQVERGFAWVYEQYNKDASLRDLQATAKAKRIGLWADASPTPPWSFRHNKGESSTNGVQH